MRITDSSAIAFLVAMLLAAPADAQLSVHTLEYGEWRGAIMALQRDPASQGRSVHVVAIGDGAQRAPCGGYQLVLDDSASRAFDVGRCDPSSGATALVLVNRPALFELVDLVARPRQVRITAIELRSEPTANSARTRAETELRCSIAARPYLVDDSGRRVAATPERFELRPVGEGVAIEASGDGWTIRSGSVRIEYELIDRQSGEVVLHETVALSCGRSTPGAEHSEVDVIELVPGRVFRGATMTRGRFDDHGSCGGEEGPEQWYVVRLDAPTRLGLRLVSEFDATLYVRAGSRNGPEIACRDEHATLETLEMNLPAGVYYVAVDGTGTHGRYRLIEFTAPADPRAFERSPRARIRNHERIVADLVSTPSRYRASCGGDGAPEHVYWFRLDEPSFVALRLLSRFDSSFYLVAANGAEIECRSATGFSADFRRADLMTELDAGVYYVVVDGESGYAAVGRYSLDLHHLPLR